MQQKAQYKDEKKAKRILLRKEKTTYIKSTNCNRSKSPYYLCGYNKGRNHDFSLFKNSKLAMNKEIETKVYLGYIGIQKFHFNSEIPKKNSKNYKLRVEDKEENHKKASKRIFVEHINAKIKTFGILKNKYRNRRKRYNLRVNLIFGLINFDRNMMVLK